MQLSLSFRSRTRLATPGEDWYHSSSGLTSTARMTFAPLFEQTLDQMSADETAGATHHDLGVFHLHVQAPNAIRLSALPKGLVFKLRQRLVSHTPHAIRPWNIIGNHQRNHFSKEHRVLPAPAPEERPRAERSWAGPASSRSPGEACPANLPGSCARWLRHR